jgi:RHS repeat-associated protein
MPSFFASILFAAALSAVSISSAQAPLPINQVGLPSNGVFSGGSIDSVQLNNGNLHVDIPLLHLPGIGMDTDIHYVYDNKVWTYKNNQPAGSASWVYAYPTRSIWSYVDPLSGGIAETSSFIQYTCLQPNGGSIPQQADTVTSLSYFDGDGTNHPFYVAGIVPDETPNCEGLVGASWWFDIGNSLDSSGYTHSTTNQGTVSIVTDKHGRKYIFNQSILPSYGTAVGPSYFPIAVEDPSGNRITSYVTDRNGSSSTTTLTDTVNRIITSTNNEDGSQTITYADQNGNTQTITVNTVQVPISYPAICKADGQPVDICSQVNLPGNSASDVMALMPSSFVLQNGDTYTIAYNSSGYGEISSITLPTGAVISYTYGNWDGTGEQVLSRTVTVNGVSSIWNYNYRPVSNYSGIEYNTATGQISNVTTVTDPNTNDTVYTCTVYLPSAQNSWLGIGPPPCYMTKEQIYSGSAGTGALLATKTTGYAISGVIMPTSDVFTWNTTGQTTETDTTWDSESVISNTPSQNISFGNVLSKTVYDYGSGTHGPLLSNTQYSYLQNTSPNGSAYLSANILDRVSGVSIYNSASSLVAQTTTAYDQFNQSSINGQGGLASSGGVNQVHDPSYNTAVTLRGLPTSVTRCSGPSSAPCSASITTYVDYNDLGKETVATDALLNSTTFTYGAQGAFVATATPPAVNGVSHMVTTNYDVNTGLLISQTDANHQTTSYTYDPRMRPLVTTRPDGGTTTNQYPSPNQVISTVVESPSPAKVTTTNLDGLGRTVSVSTAADTACGSLTVNTTYDLLGRVSAVSNPHCNGSQATDGWTESTYDAIGRTVTKTNPDGSAQNWIYNGSTVDSYDEVFNHWRRSYNAAGWLTQVLEPSGSIGAATSISNAAAPTLETDYGYDTLGNLLRVDQWGGSSGSSGDHVRTFAYDSLSRLLASNNPESASAAYPPSQSCAGATGAWTSCYAYDSNSNLHSKTDNRGITIGYQYDALNRLTNKSYSDSTPSVSFTYDTSSVPGNSNDIGELTQATVTAGSTILATTSTYSYDAMGRLQNEQQCTPANCGNSTYNLSYTYDLGGKPLSAQFPSNAPTAGTTTPAGQPVTLSYTYDNAERILTVGSTWNASGDRTHPGTLFQASSLSSGPGYGPMGLENASLGINSVTGTTAATLVRAYDERSRAIFEADSTTNAVAGGTDSSGSITISGSEEQVSKTDTVGTAYFYIGGSDGSHQGNCIQYWPYPSTTCETYQVIPDTGEIEVVITTSAGTITASGTGITPTSIAQSLATSFTSLGFPATSSGGSVTVQSNATGLSGNYLFTVLNDSDFYVSNSSSFTGGWTAGTYYDTGTLTAQVSGTQVEVPWTQGSTPLSLATNLASAINSAAGGFVTASASSGAGNTATVKVTSLNPGPDTDYSVIANTSDTNPTYFSASGPNQYTGAPSFSVATTNMGGGGEASSQKAIGTFTFTGTEQSIGSGSNGIGTAYVLGEAQVATTPATITATSATWSAATEQATILVAFRAGTSVPSIIQKNSGVGSTLAYPSNVTAGHALYAAFFDYMAANQTLTFSDSQGNTWTTVASANMSRDSDTIAIGCTMASSSAADTVTFNVNGAPYSSPRGMVVYEVAGATCAADVAPVSSNTLSATSCTSGSLTTNAANDFLFGFCTSLAANTPGVGSGWSNITYDHGDLQAIIQGPSGVCTPVLSYGKGSTPASLAAALASALNSSCSLVTATASGPAVTVTATTTGTGGDFSLYAYNQQYDFVDFNSFSFTISASGSAMTGGLSGYGSMFYSYIVPSGGYAANGNLLSVQDSVTGGWNYTYDNLNRLTGSSAAASGIPMAMDYYAGTQGSWSYDAFGNRLNESLGGSSRNSMPSSSTSVYTATNNQLNAYNGTAMTYDAAGDVTNDGLNSYLYDAEGRLCAVYNYVGAITGYVYDGAGTRVAKGPLATFSCNFAPGNFTATTSWVLGPGGEQVTEYSVSGGTSTWQHTNAFAGGKLAVTYHDTNTYFDLADWLGTKRAELGANGCLTTYASLPFGSGLTASTPAGYTACPDATEHHFTAKERDTESGNDYFGARYYASSMGRFMSPDYNDEGEEIKPVPYANLEDPQGLNQYAYAGNNPLTNIDPDGHDCQTVTWVSSFNGEVTSRSTTRTCTGLNPLERNLYEGLQRARAEASNTSNWMHQQHWIPPFLGGAPQPEHYCDYPGLPKCGPIMYGMVPWGMTGGLSGASKLFSSAEQNALGGVLKQIAQGTTKGTEFENQARAAYGGLRALPQQAAGYYTRFTVSLGAGKGSFRLVTGLGGEMYATFDHYVSWIKLK